MADLGLNIGVAAGRMLGGLASSGYNASKCNKADLTKDVVGATFAALELGLEVQSQSLCGTSQGLLLHAHACTVGAAGAIVVGALVCGHGCYELYQGVKTGNETRQVHGVVDIVAGGLLLAGGIVSCTGVGAPIGLILIATGSVIKICHAIYKFTSS
jgi:hypothetical protein